MDSVSALFRVLNFPRMFLNKRCKKCSL